MVCKDCEDIWVDDLWCKKCKKEFIKRCFPNDHNILEYLILSSQEIGFVNGLKQGKLDNMPLLRENEELRKKNTEQSEDIIKLRKRIRNKEISEFERQ